MIRRNAGRFEGFWSVDDRVPIRPLRPTKALPGSLEKIEVFISRLEQGMELHHPDDTRVTPQHTTDSRCWS